MRWMTTAALLVVLGIAPGAGALPETTPVVYRAILRPEATLQLRSHISGVALAVPKVEGDAVTRREPIILLDEEEAAIKLSLARAELESAELDLLKVRNGVRPEDLQKAEAFYEEARAGLELAGKTLEADRELHEHGVVAMLGLQRSERALEAARAVAESRRIDLSLLKKGARQEDIRLFEIAVERKRTLLRQWEMEARKCRVCSEREGRGFVSRVGVEPGQWVSAGDSVAVVVYMDRVRVELDLPADRGLTVSRGGEAVIRVPSVGGGENREARIIRVSPVVDAATGTVRVVVEAPNPDLALRPGVEAEVEIR